VGTGLKAHPELGSRATETLAELTGHPFVTAPNCFEALASRGAVLSAHGALKTLAGTMNKNANDVRWLAPAPGPALARSRSRRTSRAARSCPGR
jgi:fumarate hydratase class II